MIRIAICDDDVKEAEAAGRIVERCCREKKMVCKSRIFYDVAQQTKVPISRTKASN